jgi:hypothetical protein
MQARFGRLAGSMIVGSTVALVGAASVAFGSTPPVRDVVLAPVVVTATPVVRHKGEPHPEIMAAIRSLQAARDHLDHAAHDFNGHRVDAIAAIDAALKQLHICMQYDR